jgi:hypothetical protein
MTGVFTLGDRILATLRGSTEPMTARQVWERLGKIGAESSIGCRLSSLRLEGYVYRARTGDGDVGTPTLWRAAP